MFVEFFSGVDAVIVGTEGLPCPAIPLASGLAEPAEAGPLWLATEELTKVFEFDANFGCGDPNDACAVGKSAATAGLASDEASTEVIGFRFESFCRGSLLPSTAFGSIDSGRSVEVEVELVCDFVSAKVGLSDVIRDGGVIPLSPFSTRSGIFTSLI